MTAGPIDRAFIPARSDSATAAAADGPGLGSAVDFPFGAAGSEVIDSESRINASGRRIGGTSGLDEVRQADGATSYAT
jgi:hypothetical protein